MGCHIGRKVQPRHQGLLRLDRGRRKTEGTGAQHRVEQADTHNVFHSQERMRLRGGAQMGKEAMGWEQRNPEKQSTSENHAGLQKTVGANERKQD